MAVLMLMIDDDSSTFVLHSKTVTLSFDNKR